MIVERIFLREARQAGGGAEFVFLLWSVTFLIPPSIGGKTPIIINLILQSDPIIERASRGENK